MYDIKDHVVLILPKSDAYAMVAIWQKYRTGELVDASISRTDEAPGEGDVAPTDLGGLSSPNLEHAEKVAKSLEASSWVPQGYAKRQVDRTAANRQEPLNGRPD